MGFKAEVVDSRSTLKAFHEVPHIIYKNIPEWVPLLEFEVDEIFDPKKNKLYNGGDARRWVLRNEKGELVGRVAAFYNDKKANYYEIPTGGIGFFECIDNEEAAFKLFDISKEWLASQGMKAMDGPVNFGENDRFWGLLTEGFTMPFYGMNFHPPYYQKFFEAYGFGVYFEQVSKHLDLTKPMPERFQRIYQWVLNKPGVRFDYAKRSQVEKYTLDFMNIFNEAWKFHEHFTPMTVKESKKLAGNLKHIMLEKLMTFAYVNDEPAGFLFTLPDLNQIFKPMNGKFPLWKKLLFAWRTRNAYKWYRDRGILTRVRVMIIGVKPKFQKYGLEAGLTMYAINHGIELGFKDVELSWVGDFNTMSRKLQDATGADDGKVHKTYRIAFDPKYVWKRAEALKGDPRAKKEAEEASVKSDA